MNANNNNQHTNAHFAPIILHPHLEACFDGIKSGVEAGGGSCIQILTGPTGVGKTTLLAMLSSYLQQTHSPSQKLGSSSILVVRLSLPVAENSRALWKNILFSLIIQLSSVTDNSRGGPDSKTKGTPYTKSRLYQMSMDQLARTAVELLVLREVGYILFDDATNLLVGQPTALLNTIMDQIKFLKDSAQIVPILTGTRDLSIALPQHCQSLRRSHWHHFPSYRFDVKSEREDYARVAQTIATSNKAFSWELLSEKLPELHRGSFGCVGLLVTWCNRVVAVAKSNKIAAIRWDLFEKCKL